MTVKDSITARLERRLGIPDLVARLADELEPSELTSLLMAVYRRRCASRSPAEVLRDFERNRFTRPAELAPELWAAWDRAATACLLPEFERLTLSPVSPLGSSSVIAGVDQDWAVTTSRNVEVVSDPTNVMALVCASRRKAMLRDNPKSSEGVHLATHHRVLRPQKFDLPGFFAHFGQFALCSAGRDRGNLAFELAAIGNHVRFYVRALRAFLNRAVPIRLDLTDLEGEGRRDLCESALLGPLRDDIDGLEAGFDQDRSRGRDYYRDLCFTLRVLEDDGSGVEIGDGGSVDWTQKLISNRKERLVISGVGSERICSLAR